MRNPDFTAKISVIERMTSSVYGNPRFAITFDNGASHPTAPDSGFAYGIENPEYRDVPVSIWLDRNNNIEHVEITGTGARKQIEGF